MRSALGSSSRISRRGLPAGSACCFESRGSLSLWMLTALIGSIGSAPVLLAPTLLCVTDPFRTRVGGLEENVSTSGPGHARICFILKQVLPVAHYSRRLPWFAMNQE